MKKQNKSISTRHNPSVSSKTATSGITLIALVITIIVLLILAGVSIATLTGENGILTQAGQAKEQTEKESIEEHIKLAYNEWKLRKEAGETVDLQNIVESELNKIYGENSIVNKQGKAISINVKGNEITLIDDGRIVEGKLVCLDIAEGSIDLKEKGYIQNNQPLVEYSGKYIITGTTTENVVRVMEIGTYDITIKDLDIRVLDKVATDGLGYCAFNANRGGNVTDCYVNITLEGNNYLYGGKNAPGLGFVNGTPNVDGITNGSTLTIQGEGSLEARGGHYAAGIGNGYSGYEASAGQVSNIIINSGNIKATGGTHGSGIGGGLQGKVNNIIINGGNIETYGGADFGTGIGSTQYVDNIIINGGNIKAIGGRMGAGIGSGQYSSDSGTIKIAGGNIYASIATSIYGENPFSIIGHNCKSIKIEGGTIRTYSKKSAGIFGGSNVEITGGNLLLNGLGDIGTVDENKNFVKTTATNGQSDIYLTKIKLTNAKGNEKVTELKTSDNVAYGIKDMYVAVDDENTTDIDETGMVYLYLPKGSRTITINVNGKTYSGVVETTEEGNIVTLN